MQWRFWLSPHRVNSVLAVCSCFPKKHQLFHFWCISLIYSMSGAQLLWSSREGTRKIKLAYLGLEPVFQSPIALVGGFLNDGYDSVFSWPPIQQSVRRSAGETRSLSQSRSLLSRCRRCTVGYETPPPLVSWKPWELSRPSGVGSLF